MAYVSTLVTQTCIKQGEAFIPLSEVSALVLDDPGYVDGSIRVFAGNQPLITDDEWTDVAHWWASMGNIIEELADGATHPLSLSFPDCPIDMRFQVKGETLVWEVDGAKKRRVSVVLDQALQTLVEDYHSTFERLRVVNPAAAPDYDTLTQHFNTVLPTYPLRSEVKLNM